MYVLQGATGVKKGIFMTDVATPLGIIYSNLLLLVTSTMVAVKAFTLLTNRIYNTYVCYYMYFI